MRVLIDTNIVLDYILNREPYGEQARNIADFAGSDIPCVDPGQMCEMIENSLK